MSKEQGISSLELAWKVRDGGGGRARRDYLDFVVDGQSLGALVGGDLVSCLGWMIPNENDAALRRLLLDAPADLPNERRILYVCPECGDIGCGAITLQVDREGEFVTWRNFGYENNYEEIQTQGYEEILTIPFPL